MLKIRLLQIKFANDFLAVYIFYVVFYKYTYYDMQ